MDNKNVNIVLSTAYFPPVEYFSKLNTYSTIYIDIFENYIKQSYRNRCIIYGANGKLPLTVPVIKTNGNHTLVKDIVIDNKQSWQQIHSRSIESAYNSSPFYLYYRDDIEPFFEKRYKFLIDLNHEILQLMLKLTKISCELRYTEKYFETGHEIMDLRNNLSPKVSIGSSLFPEYTQVFGSKHGFIPGLSMIDLLFNEGRFSKDYLEKK
jgi:hypothetical protein